MKLGLRKAQREASAVSIIRSTIDQLKATNEAIDAEHAAMTAASQR